MYEYACRVVRVIDGDTVAAQLSLGFHMYFSTNIRLAGINAPELSTGEPGAKAKAVLADLLLDKPGVTVITKKAHEFEKYGRVLGTFLVDGINVNEYMLAGGYAAPMKG
jgi:micrococcal nuclease